MEVARIKPPAVGERRSSDMPDPFVRQRKCDLRHPRKSKDLPRAAKPQKVLVVELLSALPDVPGAVSQAPY